MFAFLYLIMAALTFLVVWVVAAKNWADEFESGASTFGGTIWGLALAVPACLVWPMLLPVLGVVRVVEWLNREEKTT